MYENYPMTKQGQKGRIPFKCYSSKGFFMDSFKQIKGCFQVINGKCYQNCSDLLREKIVLVIEKFF